jgi:hypothetical protein
MTRFLCGAFVLTLFTLTTGAGCSSKNEAQPNPDLKVPTVQPGDRGKDGGIAPGEKDKKAKKT